MALHRGWIKIPATMVPHGSPSPSRPPSPESVPVAALGMTASAAALPGVLAGMGEAELGAGVAEAVGAVISAPLAVGLGILFVPSRISDGPPPRRLVGSASGTGEAFVSLPPLPAPPGLVPPTESRVRPGEGGFTAAAPMPPLPGFTPVAPQHNGLPGRAAEERLPLVLDTDRNEGLPDGTNTYSPRARKAARAADPAVTQALRDAEWQAHHLINIAGLREARTLIEGAARAGWRTDDPANVAPLPVSPEARDKLDAAGIQRPVHDNPHRNWNDEVLEGLKDIERTLRDQNLQPSMDGYDKAARKALEQLQNNLRKKLLELRRLTQNDQQSQPKIA
jgi:hypothetical protein